MKEENKINSEKLTMQMRSSIYNAFFSKISKRSDINDISDKIQEVFTNSFMSDYFDSEEDINFFKKHKNLLEFTYVYITPEVLDIEITEERYKSIDSWYKTTYINEDDFNHIQEIAENANQLDKRAPFDKLVNNSFSK